MVKLSRILFVVYIFLVITGLLFIINSSVVDAYRDFGNRWAYFFRQFIWLSVSIISYVFISRLPTEKILSKTSKIYWLGIAALVLVLVPGIGVKIYGARRWLNLGISLIQPSEFMKTILIITLAYLNNVKNPGSYQFLFVGFLPVFLILLQPDLGTALVVASIVICMYFVSKLSLKKLFPLLSLGLVFLSIYIMVSPYRRERLKTYMRIAVDPQKESYQSNQSLIAIGRGGIFGVGLGQSFQKYNYLPESSTDSIFSIIAEEGGFVGSSLLLFAYIILISVAFKISASTNIPLYSHTAFGIAILISAQTLLNLGALTGLLPLTGVPLPFISYGGSSLLNFSVSLGILSSIALTCQKPTHRS